MKRTISMVLVAVAWLMAGCSPATTAPPRPARVSVPLVADPMTFLSTYPEVVRSPLVADKVGDFAPDIVSPRYAADGTTIFFDAEFYVDEDVYLYRVYRAASISSKPVVMVRDREKWSAADTLKADATLHAYLDATGDGDYVDSRGNLLVELPSKEATPPTLRATNNIDGSCYIDLVESTGKHLEVFRNPGIKHGKATVRRMVADPDGFVVLSLAFDEDIMCWDRLYRFDVATRAVIPLGTVGYGEWDYSPKRKTILFVTEDRKGNSQLAEYPAMARDAAASPRYVMQVDLGSDTPSAGVRASGRPVVADPTTWLADDSSTVKGKRIPCAADDVYSMGFTQYAADQRGLFTYLEWRDGAESFVERVFVVAEVDAPPSVAVTDAVSLMPPDVSDADPGLRALVKSWQGRPTVQRARTATGKKVALVVYNDANSGDCQLDIVDGKGTHAAVIERAGYFGDEARIARVEVDPEGFAIVGLLWPEWMVSSLADPDGADDPSEGVTGAWRGIEYLYRLDLASRRMTPVGKVLANTWAYAPERNAIGFLTCDKDGNPRFAEYLLH